MLLRVMPDQVGIHLSASAASSGYLGCHVCPGPPRDAFGTRFQTLRRPTIVSTDDDVKPTSASEVEDEDDRHEPGNETEADIEIVPDLAKTAN
jgi:hypothetical protein